MLAMSFTTLAQAKGGAYLESHSNRTDDGSRALILSGTFVNADSVYIQIYHEGELTKESTAYKVFTITLREFNTYDIKFTDINHRSKSIYIRELADVWEEFVPAFEIDFDVVGNITLVKTNVRRPNFIEFETGLGRSPE